MCALRVCRTAKRQYCDRDRWKWLRLAGNLEDWTGNETQKQTHPLEMVLVLNWGSGPGRLGGEPPFNAPESTI